jgi:hypothetical protein
MALERMLIISISSNRSSLITRDQSNKKKREKSLKEMLKKYSILLLHFNFTTPRLVSHLTGEQQGARRWFSHLQSLSFSHPFTNTTHHWTDSLSQTVVPTSRVVCSMGMSRTPCVENLFQNHELFSES